MTRPAPSCFTQDNTRADGFTGHEIYAQMTSGPGTGSAQAGANAAAQLERTYAGIETRLKRVGETLGEAWTGASADAAQAAGNPINQAMIQMQDSLRQADHSLSNQVYQFNYNKSQLKNMPEKKPDTGFWDDVTPWDTDAEDAVNGYNSDESHNRKVYREFQSASNTNRGDLPKEFPGVTADNLNIEVTNTGGDDGRDKTTNTSTGRPSGNTGTGFPNPTGSPTGPPGTTWTPPGGDNGGRTDLSWAGGGDGGGGGGGGNKPGDLGGVKPPAGNVIDRPPNAGIPPIGVPGGPGPAGQSTGRGPGGGGKFGGGPGGGGKFGGGPGGAGKMGGLGGTGTGSGTSAQQPGGKSGVFGGMGEHGPNAGGRGGAGAAGRGGAAGAGGMGGHGQKGQGEDDLEHKSADYLITEENTNEIIGDMPMVAPPTIGG
ncbi:PPE domain-containing protein [Lentzea aerocolonigenes]|uniref:PPE domain-containing protein n=1 Tax=Lentzea aerocolonigenes TaxID=68170 RepID=UPI0004C32B13|nr:PPE domain-containing protein [Lentzea aerocolonigenes]MCP2249109.1 PPE family protein [Lentzea aerocolonigenes]